MRAVVAVGGMMCMVVCVGEREVQACVVRRRPARRRVQAVRVRVRRCLARRATREVVVERVGPGRRPGPGASELQLTAFINSWVARAAEVTGHDGSLKSLVM